MQLEKKYNPEKVEKKWYRFWEENSYFHSEVDSTKIPFTIVIPPPNITGILHMGHGLNNTIQDILIRWKRMQNYNVLWLPGTDHAGIATQNVVEKKLAKDGKTRQEVGRERFIELIWDWKKQYGDTIIKQLRKFGASCDWKRERFTMDNGLSRAVKEVFVRLFNEGLIYKGKYIINWCPRCQTALSDEEVEHKTEKGFLYYILYPFKNEKEGITIATTRPETMLGDTAVAVNPLDARYKNYIGKTVILPLVNREIPIISDSYVEMDFGTGALKITPAHDPNDFEVGKRHNLEEINIFNIDATINENGISDCIGMDRYECREVVIEEIRKRGFFIKQETYTHEVGHCYRCHAVIEPYLSEQWFVKMKPLAKSAIDVVHNNEITFYPERWKKVYLNWMNNIRDWCISRQIWWGHRIPIYYCRKCENIFASVEKPDNCKKCKSTNIYQDEDVLDTWFSSQLWPFSTLGWPEETEDLKYYYPTDVLVTDPGILFFWVSRMIMSGLKFMNKIPFKNVYIHGVVMDDQGRKMSKSLGNGIDPIDVVEKYGADAMRYTIVNITSLGQNLLLSMDKFNIGARFANKIWNASRYILMNIEGMEIKEPEKKDFDSADKWILTKYEETIKKMNIYFEEFKLNEASSLIYDFFWHEFCDWYIEISKVKLTSKNNKVRCHAASMFIKILEGSIRLLHPIMPFITEEVWQLLPVKREKESIMISEYPHYNQNNLYPESVKKINILKEVTYNIRNIRGEMNVPPETKTIVFIKTKDTDVEHTIKDNIDIIIFLARLSKLEIGENIVKPSGSASAVGSGYEIYLPLKDLINIEKERSRLNKELEKIESGIKICEMKLSNESFLNKAKAHVVERETERLVLFEEAKKKVLNIINSLN